MEEGLVNCLTKSGCPFGEVPHWIHWWTVSPNLGVYWWVASPNTLVEKGLVSCFTKSGCLFGEMPSRIHWWKGVWWVVSPNLGVYLVSCFTEYIGGKGPGELSHQIWVSIWWVGCLVSCLTKSGRLFGELLHRIHWWKGIWWVVSPNLGVYLGSWIPNAMCGELSHQIWVSIWCLPEYNGVWWVASPNLGSIWWVASLVEGGLGSCLTKSGCLFGELHHRIHWWKRVW